MSALLSDPVSWLFAYLLAGAIVWMFNATSLLGFAIGAYARRHGRLPTMAMQAMACAAAILLWPRVLVARAKAWGRV